MSRIEASSAVVPRSESLSSVGQWRAALPALGLLLLAHVPLLIQHATHMWNRPHYQFFPLVPIGAGVLAIAGLRGITQLAPGSRSWSLSMLGVSLVLLSVGVLANSPWLGAVSAMISLAAVIITLGGRELMRRLLPAWLLLGLAVPPPLDLDVRLITWLQRFTAAAGSAILDIWPFQVLHMMSGTIVEVPGQRLLVEEACSGIHSLFAALACTIFFVFWARRPMIRSVLLIVAAVFWVLAANITRVVAITYAHTNWDLNLTEGAIHTLFGLVLFAITLSLIVSTDRLLLFFTPRRFLVQAKARQEARGMDDEAPLPDASALPDMSQTALSGFSVAIAFGLVVAFQLWTFTGGAAEATASEPEIPFSKRELGADALPVTWGAWRRSNSGYRIERRNHRDPQGAYSQIWEYQNGDLRAIASLDLPFHGWHDLTICYHNVGWTQIDRVFHTATEDGQQPFVEVKLSKGDDENGYLLFGLHDATGRAIEPLQTLWNRLGSRLKAGNLWKGSQRFFYSDADAKSFQVQLLVESDQPLRRSQEVDAQQFYEFLRKELSRKWVEAAGGESP